MHGLLVSGNYRLVMHFHATKIYLKDRVVDGLCLNDMANRLELSSTWKVLDNNFWDSISVKNSLCNCGKV